jgi:trimethylamine--corrinoid protein Co-methyltransferase
MSNSYRTTSSFSACTPDQLYRIHLASLAILERTGVSVQEPEARALLLDAGAWEGKGDLVRIPAFLVKVSLQTAPERVCLYDRLGRPAMPMEASNVFFGTGSDTPNTIDPLTGARRLARNDDVRKFALLCDALPNIDFVMSMGVPSDVPPSLIFVHEFDRMVAGTSKPLVFTAYDNRDMETIFEIATVVAGSPQTLRQRPFLLLYSEPLSPLQHTRIGTEKILFCAERGIPFVYVTGVFAGACGPATLAGCLAMANAECLSGLVISQLKCPGAPFIYGGNVGVLDMRAVVGAYAAPEFSLTNALFVALAHYYKLPVWGLAGASDAKTLDAQAAVEAAFSLFAATLAGANLVHDVGYLESGLTSSMEMIALADEIIPMCRHFNRGIDLSDDDFALDLIDRVGPGGSFLDTRHTRDNFRRVQWFPRLMDRFRFDKWESSGSLSLSQRLNAHVRRILDTHVPTPLPDDKRREIDRILQARAAADANTKR